MKSPPLCLTMSLFYSATWYKLFSISVILCLSLLLEIFQSLFLEISLFPCVVSRFLLELRLNVCYTSLLNLPCVLSLTFSISLGFFGGGLHSG